MVTVLLVVAGAVAGTLVGIAVGVAVGRTRADARAVEPIAPGESAPAGVLSVDQLVDDHPTGVVVSDPMGRVAYRNAAASRLSGTHAGTLLDEAVGRHLSAARGGTISHETLEFFGPPRSVFEVTARPLEVGGSVAFVDDVSERRRVDQVRTDFVANISHELRTPVGALSVLAETLAGEDDLATIRRLVARMLDESERAARTIDDLIELSRIESGGEQVREPVRIADVVRGAVERVTELAARRSIAISSLDPVVDGAQRSAGMIVLGDRRQLVSAVGNLVENAVKYSEPGSSVHVRATATGGWIEISVVDQGVGIPQRDLDRVFERFYRVDRARSRTTGGTGLGLSIVRHVASNHGGAVVVTSTEGEGSTFVLRLPAHATATADHRGADLQRSEGVA